ARAGRGRDPRARRPPDGPPRPDLRPGLIRVRRLPAARPRVLGGRDRAHRDGEASPLVMPEVRIDPLTGLRSIVAGDRAGRPGGGLSCTAPDPIDPEKDPFLEGHEDRTPPELYRAGGGEPDTPGWTVRVVPNLYPALTVGAAAPERDANPDLFSASAARGSHEVVINAPQPLVSLSQVGSPQVAAAVD